MPKPEDFQASLREYLQNPALEASRFRSLLESEPEVLFNSAGLLKSAPGSKAARHAALLIRNSSELLPYLRNPNRSSFEKALELTNLILAADPTFGRTLLEITVSAGDLITPDEQLRLLDLLVASGAPIPNWRKVARLSETGSFAIKNKCMRLVALHQSGQKIDRMFGASDARGRADLVEALAASSNPRMDAVLSQALSDGNNRVAANAAVIAYQAGDKTVLRRLANMLAPDQPLPFRISAAWAMGQTKDARFGAGLLEAARTDEPKLREAAMRAMTKLEKLDSLRRDDSLQLWPVFHTPCSFSVDDVVERTLFLREMATDCGVEEIAGELGFYLFEGGTPIIDYSVKRPRGREARIRLVCSAPALEEIAPSLTLKKGVPIDRISVYGARPDVAMHKSMNGGDFRATSLGQAAKTTLADWHTDAEKHILLILDAKFPFDLHLPLFEAECLRANVVVHVCEFDSGVSSSESHVHRFKPNEGGKLWASYQDAIASALRITFEGRLKNFSLRVRTPVGISERLIWQ